MEKSIKKVNWWSEEELRPSTGMPKYVASKSERAILLKLKRLAAKGDKLQVEWRKFGREISKELQKFEAERNRGKMS